jgi:hypothetical protein
VQPVAQQQVVHGVYAAAQGVLNRKHSVVCHPLGQGLCGWGRRGRGPRVWVGLIREEALGWG